MDLAVRVTTALWDQYLQRHQLRAKVEDVLNLNFALKEVQLGLNVQLDFIQTV